MNPSDLPALPPPGHSACFPLPVLMAAGSRPPLTGLVLAPDGRLTIACNGAGLAVRLEAADAAQLSVLLWQLANKLANDANAAADTAAAELDKIVKEAAGNA